MSHSPRLPLPRQPRNDSLPPVAPRPWPPALSSVVLRAHQAETEASGPERRMAFRRTRALITGARLAGFSLHDIADLLGIGIGSVRNRAGDVGVVGAEDITALTGLGPDRIEQWRRLGWLADPVVGPDGRELYAADDLVRALCRLEGPVP